MFRGIYKKKDNNVVVNNTKLRTEVIQKTKHDTRDIFKLSHKTDPDALDKSKVLALISAEFDNKNMAIKHAVSSPTAYNKNERSLATDPLYKIPTSEFDYNIPDDLAPRCITLKLIAPDIDGHFHPEHFHFIKLEFSGFMFKFEKYNQIETIDIMNKNHHIETIERKRSCISLNDMPLDQFLAKHLDLPNVKQILDFYQNTYSKPMDKVIWNEPANTIRPK